MSNEMKITELGADDCGLPPITYEPIIFNDIWKIEVHPQGGGACYIELTNKDGEVIFDSTNEGLALERQEDE